MSISPISLSLPYQGRTITIDDISKLEKLRFIELFEIRRIAEEIGSNLEHDLGCKIYLIQDTLTKHLPEAKEQTKNILIACLKTSFLISLIAVAIFGGLFVAPEAGLALIFGSFAFVTDFLFYAIAQEGFVFPERRTREGTPPGPWFCPNIETFRGKMAAATVLLPLIGGLVLPLVEACTRKSRWESVLAKQNENLAEIIPSYCEFYKQHGVALVEKLNEKIQGPQDRWSYSSKERWEKALECVYAQVAFLKNFDPNVPELTVQNAEHAI